ncbi:metal ABC transporter substrate-binding protein [Risungbinella massiliensis]|uniref:metal ABC transporter substrate-binding protein n=1 Tax=Risungbinella massiliensis TaxID=1329796 RepID=UPI0005CC108B|nr:metal ABC transporter substrate-binding protein [Risungbinella massiliensis]
MKRNWKKIGLSALSLGLALFLTACGTNEEAKKEAKTKTEKVSIYTSTYALEDFAKKIGGTHVEVTNLVPVGVEPHDFEPSAKEIAQLNESDIFLYNGAGLETWVDKTLSSLDKNKTKVINTTDQLSLLKVAEEEEHGHGHEHEHEEEAKKEDDHDHGEFDPHVWLDPTLANQQAMKIRDALIQQDPAHKADYEKNFATLEANFNQLDQEFQEMVKKAPKKEFVTSHAAFQYLAKRYGLEQVAISGISPQDEPSPAELKEIVEMAREHGVKYIMFETLVSSKIADVVRNEVKAEALTLNPVEGLTKEEQAQGADYFSVMRKNKENLAKALGVTQ